MTTILENLTENIKTWTNTAASRASEITKRAATKAESLSRVGRLKMDIYQIERQQQRYLADLGRVAFDQIEDKSAPALFAGRPDVKQLMVQLSELSAKIERLQTEIDASSNASVGEGKHVESAMMVEKKAAITVKKSTKKSASPKKAVTAKGSAKKKSTPAPKTSTGKNRIAKSKTSAKKKPAKSKAKA